MDSGYHIGYRIDVVQDRNNPLEIWSLPDEIKICGAEPYGLSKWNVLPHNDRKQISFHWMNSEINDYRCPIDQTELHENLFKDSFDYPDDGEKVMARIKNMHLYRELKNLYGEGRLKVRWGISLLLS